MQFVRFTMRTHRFLCPSAPLAIAIAAFLTAEGYAASWAMSPDDGPVVMALCPTEAAREAVAYVGGL